MKIKRMNKIDSYNHIFHIRMKDIVGYEGLYGIEEDGRVWSYGSNKYLKATVSNHGYFRIGLVKDNITKKYLIHRLIAIAYIPNPDNKPFIDHINRNRVDNTIENLRWVDMIENNQNLSYRNDNVLNEHHIVYETNRKRFRFRVERNHKYHNRYFITLQEAIDYRDEYLSTICLF